jgi:cephalosporin-C deacetylase-like acetyl esterase
MNYLKAVFWDYPQLTNREQLLKFIQESKKSTKVYRWLLKRFLEHARVVDTLEYFSLQEIARYLPDMNLAPYSRKKWKRIIEVYGKA